MGHLQMLIITNSTLYWKYHSFLIDALYSKVQSHEKSKIEAGLFWREVDDYFFLFL